MSNSIKPYEYNTITIGYISNMPSDFVSTSLFNGISDAADAYNVNLILLNEGSFESLNDINKREVDAFKLLKSNDINGLIIWTPSIEKQITSSKMSSFLNFFDPMHIVTIAESIENYHCVLNEYYNASKSLMNHIINVHGAKKIAFFHGEECNLFLDYKLQAYKDSLIENGIQYNAKFVSSTLEIDNENLCKSIKKTNIQEHLWNELDAIFCCNDVFAKTLIDKFKEYDIKVPEDIIVVGFNNNISDLSSILTTVYPSFYGVGYKSLQTICQIIEGKDIERKIYVPSQVIIRQSCGCNNKVNAVSNLNHIIENNEFNTMINNCGYNSESFKESLKKINDNCMADFEKDFIDGLLDMIIKQIEESNYEDVRTKFNEYKTMFLNSKNIYAFELILTTIKEKIECFISDKDIQKIIELIFSEWYELLYSTREYVENSKWSITPDEISYFSVRGRFLSTASSLSNLFDIIESDLSLYNIPGCFIILFDSNGKKRLALSINDFKRKDLKDEDIVLKDEDILPEFYHLNDKRSTLIIKGLYSKMEMIGYILFYQRPKFNLQKSKGNFIYSILKASINAGINSALIKQERENIIKDMDIINKDLLYKIDELKRTQQQLIQSEKMVTLGKLVAGIAKEVNKPIGAGFGAAALLDQKLGEFIEKCKQNSLKKSDLNNYLNTYNEVCNILISNLKKASQIIESFKRISVDQTNEEKRLFNVKKYIEWILISLSPHLNKTNHKINIICDETIEIISFPGLFYQIISNLIMNTLIHAYDDVFVGTITIQIEKNKKNVCITYSDDGKGIKKEFLDNIIEPFFTTGKKDEDTGLGLSVIYNIITQILKGTLTCKSEEGHGTTFVIKVPVD